MPRGRILILTAVLLGGSAAAAQASDWLRFRGPDGSGVAEDKGLPVTWSADANIAWKTELPGPGGSSPIVVGDRVFVTCYTGYAEDRKDRQNPGDLKALKRHLLCLSRADGKVLWTKTIPATGPEPKLQSYLELHGYASSTPCSDGKQVYVFFGTSGVFAFGLAGEQLWQASVGKGTSGWGSATSSIVYKDLVIVNASVESGALIALDRGTGKEVWRARGMSSSWSTPVLVKVPGGKTELVVSASKQVLGLDPETGKLLWHADSFDWYVCPSVVAHEGVVYALQNSTYVAVRAGGQGDVTKTHTLWQKSFGSVVSSPVYYEGHLYWSPGGTAYCQRADDGTVVYKERLKPDPGGIYASPVAVDGKVYYVSRSAGTYVVEAGPKFKLLALNTLTPDTSICNGSLAVSRSQLLLRSDRYLYCIGKER
jgi:outer membrane protein assembly factor BamB